MSTKHFNLPWHQEAHYWLAALLPDNAPSEFLVDLSKIGFKSSATLPNCFLHKTPSAWRESFLSLKEAMAAHRIAEKAQIAVIAGEQEPRRDDIAMSAKSLDAVSQIADALWLGDALMHDRVVCYLQPIMDKRGKIFGYESFARMETEHGEPVGGGQIIAAARTLKIEHMLDRQLHVKAIRSFVEADLHGFLFVNFVPGFIHRPEVYLEGLSEAAQTYGMPAKQIVLDLTNSEKSSDVAHLRNIFDFCRSRGYATSIDDIESVDIAQKLMTEIRPDFLKLDIRLVRRALNAADMDTIRKLVDIAHKAGGTILAEGVETDEVHKQLLAADVDLFQGYLFSPPVAVTLREKRVVTGQAG